MFQMKVISKCDRIMCICKMYAIIYGFKICMMLTPMLHYLVMSVTWTTNENSFCAHDPLVCVYISGTVDQ